jgi:predicted XRE-type DNA-binding protein
MRKNTTKNTTKRDGDRSGAGARGAAVTDSSGDVFADLGVRLDRGERLKVDIAIEISDIIARRGLTQAQVAEIIGADQAKVSNLTRGKLKGFSLDRLLQYVSRLGYDIDLYISQNRRGLKRNGDVRLHHEMTSRQ